MTRVDIAILGALFALSASGCATNKPLPPGLHTESKSDGGVKILNVGLLHDNSGLLVYGTVKRIPGYFDSPFRHLDLEIIGPSGKFLTQQAVRFFPNPIPHSRFGSSHSSYSERLTEIPLPGSTIRITVHTVAIAKCGLPKAGNR